MKKQKTILITTLLLLLPCISHALERTISYQGFLVDTNNTPINGKKNITFKLYNENVKNPFIWDELHENVPIIDGNFNVVLGETDDFSDDIFQSNEKIYIGITIDADQEMTPRQLLTGAPFAIYAHLANNIVDNAITTEKIADNSITMQKLNFTPLVKDNGNFSVSGNLGVLTELPKANLEVNGTSIFIGDIGFFGTNPVADIPDDGFRLKWDKNFFGETLDAIIFEKTDGNNEEPDGGFVFTNHAKDGISNTSMVIRGDGKIGIGTKTPYSLLHTRLENSLANPYSDNTFGHYVRNGFANAIFEGPDSSVQIIAADNGWHASDLILTSGHKHWIISHKGPDYNNRYGIGYRETTDHGSQLSGRESFVILPNGKTGVGTINPQAKLHVYHSVDVFNWFGHFIGYNNNETVKTIIEGEEAILQIIGEDEDDHASDVVLTSGNKHWIIAHRGPNSENRFSIGYKTTDDHNESALAMDESFVIKTDGKVGIGTTTPSHLLSVQGDAGGTSNWQTDSDERLKKNISTIKNASEKIQKLRGVQFEWKDSENHPKGKKIGLIAQETKDIVPEVVNKNDEYYSIEYAPITALLIEAFKELKAENDALKEIVCEDHPEKEICQQTVSQ